MGTRFKATQSQYSFAQVPSANIPRSVFNRSHGYTTTFDFGYLIPFLADEALPGDTLSCQVQTFVRFATPIHPIMDNMYVDTFFFAVPNRLLWDNWEKFNGAQDNPGDSTSFQVPQMVSPASVGYDWSSLSDYLGIPPGVPDFSHSSLWHRAYNLIWNEWFRDENIQDSVTVDTDDGPDDPSDYVLLRRGKRHDYFTSCLPWPQKGSAVELPLGSTAPLTITGDNTAVTMRGLVSGGGTDVGTISSDYTNPIMTLTGITGTGVSAFKWESPGLTGTADLQSATAATINDIREAFQMQKMLERDARGGTRYTELVRSHFGVVSPDARLQRPEYLGGGTQRLNITPVPQTSSTDATTPQGNLSGFGVSSSGAHGFSKSFTEHCTIIGLVMARADLRYSQGVQRQFNRLSRFDYYWPALAHLGEQPVYKQEIYTRGSLAPGSDTQVLGYQERYAEYRYFPSMITGQFRTDHPTSLSSWHLAQDWISPPILNNEFIIEDPPVDRVIAVPSEPHLLADFAFNYKAARPMPTYGVPGFIDRF